MELFAFFVGGGQTHHREIFFLGRHKKLLQPEKRGVFTYKKQNQKLFCLLKHFTRLSEYFFSQSQRGGGGTCMVLLFK
jgi:hypothetical protein